MKSYYHYGNAISNEMFVEKCLNLHAKDKAEDDNVCT